MFFGMMQFKLSLVQNTVAIQITFALQLSVQLDIPIKFRRSLLLGPEDQTFR
jgi:hypothetical protein